MINPELEIEAAYDRQDDLGKSNAYQIREDVGMETHDSSDFTAEAILARNPHLEIQDSVEPADLVGTPDDVRHYDFDEPGWIETFSDPQTKKVVKTGIQACRAAIRKTREDQ